MRRRLLLKAALLCACLSGITSAPATAADLQVRTSQAFDEYVERAKQAFLSRTSADGQPALRRDGVIVAGPGKEDGILEVPGGLLHHWVAKVFLPGVTLHEAVDLSQRYSAYSTIYKSVVASRVLERRGDTYRVLMRLKESEAGLSEVLEIRATVQYVAATPRSTYAFSNTDEIREVKNVGARDEQLLPAGRDSGYLWRASTFSYYLEQKDGLYVETETFGLSRQFPTMLGWIIEPIARRLGRKSVEASLQEFIAAIQTSRQQGVRGKSQGTSPP